MYGKHVFLWFSQCVIDSVREFAPYHGRAFALALALAHYHLRFRTCARNRAQSLSLSQSLALAIALVLAFVVAHPATRRSWGALWPGQPDTGCPLALKRSIGSHLIELWLRTTRWHVAPTLFKKSALPLFSIHFWGSVYALNSTSFDLKLFIKQLITIPS